MQLTTKLLSAQYLAAIPAIRHAASRAQTTLDRHSAPAMSFKESQSPFPGHGHAASPGSDRKQASSTNAAICPNGSVTLPRDHGNDVTLRMSGAAHRTS